VDGRLAARRAGQWRFSSKTLIGKSQIRDHIGWPRIRALREASRGSALRTIFSPPTLHYDRDGKPDAFWGLRGSASVRNKHLTITAVNPWCRHSRTRAANKTNELRRRSSRRGVPAGQCSGGEQSAKLAAPTLGIGFFDRLRFSRIQKLQDDPVPIQVFAL
jgi:hypothetical protein